MNYPIDDIQVCILKIHFLYMCTLNGFPRTEFDGEYWWKTCAPPWWITGVSKWVILIGYILRVIQNLTVDGRGNLYSNIYTVLYMLKIPCIWTIIIRKGFRGDFSNLVVEFMSRFKLDHHGKPGKTGRPFRASMVLFIITHPWSSSWDSNAWPISLVRVQLGKSIQ